MTYKILRKQNNSYYCAVCGTNNPYTMGAKFYECENESGEQVLLTIFKPQEEHQSYPGRTHGGAVAAVLDESIGRAACIPQPGIWGVTIDLNVKYRKPTPLGVELFCESKTTKITNRTFEGEGRVFDKNNTTLATATGRYIMMDPKNISDGGLNAENWFYVNEELPCVIEIK